MYWNTENNSSEYLHWPWHFYLNVQGILAYYALGRYRRGVNEVTIPTYTEPPLDPHSPYPATYIPTSYNPTTYTPTTYTAYPSSVPDMHQQPPFTASPQPQGDVAYQPPNYWDKGSSHRWGGVPGHLLIEWLKLHCTDTELYHIDVVLHLIQPTFLSVVRFGNLGSATATVREEVHCGLLLRVCGQILRHQAECWD